MYNEEDVEYFAIFGPDINFAWWPQVLEILEILDFGNLSWNVLECPDILIIFVNCPGNVLEFASPSLSIFLLLDISVILIFHQLFNDLYTFFTAISTRIVNVNVNYILLSVSILRIMRPTVVLEISEYVLENY